MEVGKSYKRYGYGMVKYLRRVADAELDELLSGVAAITLDGPKGVGKTETALRRATSVLALDDPIQRELMVSDPARVEQPGHLLLIDEWQRLPQVWDAVRRSVDRNPRPGRFLLTGSATPSIPPTHSGAGRIVRVRMRPMSLAERGLQPATVSLAELLDGGRPNIGGESALDLAGYAEHITYSGFPAIRTGPARAVRAQLDGYLDQIVEKDFPDQGHLVRRPDTLRRWLRAYAAATATTASYNVILDAATPGESTKPAKTTTLAYRDVLSQLWLLDPVPGWTPSRNVFSRLTQAPKHHLADPALAARLLGVDPTSLLNQKQDTALPQPGAGPLLGALFESLVTLSVRIYAQAAECSVHHLRTHDTSHEIDLIITRADQKVLAIEVKLAPTVTDTDVKHLVWLRERLGEDLLDALVVTTGPYAYRRPDGIAVVPAGLLGP